MPKQRLDMLITEMTIVSSRAEARRRILAGDVTVDGDIVSKSGALVRADAHICLRGPKSPYVGRGGHKLEWALDTFNVDVADHVVLDAGASTGGFTDCLLQRGAKLVYALDVGHGQLAWRLRQDPRVRVLEKTNIRDADAAMFDTPITMATADLAFIGLSKVLHVFAALLPENANLIALVKPHFEAGREYVERGGLVRNPEVHRRALLSVASVGRQMGLHPVDVTHSPIRGSAGNIEFFLRLTRSEHGKSPELADLVGAVGRAVSQAHDRLTDNATT